MILEDVMIRDNFSKKGFLFSDIKLVAKDLSETRDFERIGGFVKVSPTGAYMYRPLFVELYREFLRTMTFDNLLDKRIDWICRNGLIVIREAAEQVCSLVLVESWVPEKEVKDLINNTPDIKRFIKWE